MHIERTGALMSVQLVPSSDASFYLMASPSREVFSRLWQATNTQIQYFDPGNLFAADAIFDLTHAGVLSGELTWEQADELYFQASLNDGIALQDYPRWVTMTQLYRINWENSVHRDAIHSDLVSNWRAIVIDPFWKTNLLNKAVAQSAYIARSPDAQTEGLDDAILDTFAGVASHVGESLQSPSEVFRVFDEAMKCIRLFNNTGR